MRVHELKKKFFEERQYTAEDANVLLDFARKAYIYNEIASSEYKRLVRELEALGAKFPDDASSENSFIHDRYF